MNSITERPFRWYREPVAWLGIVVLLTAMGGCISLIRTATLYRDADLPDPVDRSARMQVPMQRLSSALPAQARLTVQSGELRLHGNASEHAPDRLEALFWSTRIEHDVSVSLRRHADGSYVGLAPQLPQMPMHVRIDTPSRDDALVGEWPAMADAAILREPMR